MPGLGEQAVLREMRPEIWTMLARLTHICMIHIVVRAILQVQTDGVLVRGDLTGESVPRFAPDRE